jgi:hypothetical protein
VKRPQLPLAAQILPGRELGRAPLIRQNASSGELAPVVASSDQPDLPRSLPQERRAEFSHVADTQERSVAPG